MPHYSEGTNPQRFRCALSKSQHLGSLMFYRVWLMFWTNDHHMEFLFPLARICKSGILGFKIVMEALKIILTVSFATSLLSVLLILDSNSTMRIGVPLTWKLRLNLINLVLCALHKQAKTKIKREKMILLSPCYCVCLFPSRESIVTATLVGRKKMSVQLPYLNKVTRGSYPSPYWVENHGPLSFKLKAKKSVVEKGSHKIQLIS